MARARNTDPTTSHEAAEAATVGSGILRLRVHKVMAQHADWMTHEEILAAYQRHAHHNDWSPASESGVRSRVRELYEDGWVERDSGDTVKNARGRSVHQWRAVTDPATAAKNRDRYLADIHFDTVHLPQIKAEEAAGRRERQQEGADALVEAGDAQDAAEQRYATETEHVDALPLDAILLYVGGDIDRSVVHQQTHVGRWASPGSSKRVTAEDIALPCLILHVPADADVDLTQFPTEP